MARGVNKVILVGNCGSDPEVRYMPNGGAVTNLSIATADSWKDKQTGQMQERTEWHRVVFFGKLAEIAGEYLRKGSQVYIEGSLRTRKWQDNQGQDRYTTEIVVDINGQMQMLGGRGNNNDGGYASQGGNQSGYSQAPQQGGYAQQPQQGGGQNYSASKPQQAPQQAAQPQSSSFDDFDDDIPF